MIDSFDDYAASLRQFIDVQAVDSLAQAPGSPAGDDRAFNELALSLFRLQYASVPPYRLLCDSLQRVPGDVTHWTEIPAVPTRAFKDLDFSSLAAGERTTVFHSSGTTGQRPSRHFHNASSLAIYEASLWPWFRAHLLGDLGDGEARDGAAGPEEALVPGSIRLVFLTPPVAQAPHSSLVHMFAAIQSHFRDSDARFAGQADAAGGWTLDVDRVWPALSDALAHDQPVALLGSAFSFVHLLDQLIGRGLSWALPAGSRVMETGGYKGRSQVLAQTGLHGLMTERLGIPSSHIAGEYGMSELSSQAYDRAIGPKGVVRVECERSNPERCFRFPPWARARIVSPETGREVEGDQRGLLRLVDLANMRSVLAVQSEDVAVRRGTGFAIMGRAAQAEPRGCSLAADL